MRNRLAGALVAYGVLIAIAWFQLSGQVRWAVLILFAGLIAKTLIAIRAGWQPPDDTPDDKDQDQPPFPF